MYNVVAIIYVLQYDEFYRLLYIIFLQDGKVYTVSDYPEDCSKYVICSGGKCKLETCEPTYVFDPVTSTCSHQRGSVNCDNFKFSRKLWTNHDSS